MFLDESKPAAYIEAWRPCRSVMIRQANLEMVDWLETLMAEVSGSGTSWSLASKDWDGGISAGDSLGVRFIVGYSGSKVSILPPPSEL